MKSASGPVLKNLNVCFGSEAAGRGPAGGVAAIVRSGTHWVAAISISVRVRRSYSAKNRRIYLQNLAGTARCRSSFRRIYFGNSQPSCQTPPRARAQNV
jgi:hypothetical protein